MVLKLIKKTLMNIFAGFHTFLFLYFFKIFIYTLYICFRTVVFNFTTNYSIVNSAFGLLKTIITDSNYVDNNSV